MPFDPRAERLPVDCPNCGHSFQEELGRFERQDSVTCPKCQQSIRLSLKNPQDLRSAQRALDDLDKAFRKLGKG